MAPLTGLMRSILGFLHYIMVTSLLCQPSRNP